MPRPAYALRTSFIGRREDMARLRAALDDGARWISLCGPPGVGKSRLAAELARALADEADGEVAVVAVADVDDADGLISAVAAALGIRRPSADSVGFVLAEQPQLVLILDDYDRLIEAGAQLVRGWLAAAHGLALVVTSRERSGSPVETLVELGPLPVTDAVALFDQRARAVAPSWDANAHRELVTAVVDRLDRLPLAVELAAARMDLLGPADLLANLDRRRDALAAADPAGRRHRTLSAALELSWQGLSAAEETALARLSVFRGRFSLAAADAVCDVPDGDSLIDILHGLRRKSLLVTRPDAAQPGRQRFSLYETVRRDAARRLEASGDAPAVRARHAAFFATANDVSDDELADVLAVVDWATPSQPALALEAVFAAEPLLWRRGRAHEIVRHLHQVLDTAAAEAVPAAERARALELRGRARRVCGDIVTAREDLDGALARWTELGDAVGRGRIHRELGTLELVCGEPARGRCEYEASAQAHRACGDRLGEAAAIDGLAGALYELGELERALELATNALRIVRELGARDKEAIFRGHVGLLALESGAVDEAAEHLAGALAIHRELGHVRFEAAELNNLGLVAQERGDLDEAIERLEHALALHRNAGDVKGTAISLVDLGVCREESGDIAGARAAYTEALSIARLVGDGRNTALALAYLGRSAAREGRERAARAAWSEAAALLDSGRFPDIAAILAVCRGHLDGDAGERDPGAAASSGYRAALRILSAGDATSPSALVVYPTSRSFTVGASRPKDLRERPTLWRVLAHLVDRRLANPGTPVSREELFGAGWPGEHVAERSAAGRVRSAIWTLRKMGLGGLVSSSTEGYVLAVDVAVEHADDAGENHGA